MPKSQSKLSKIIEYFATWFIILPKYKKADVTMGKKISQISLYENTFKMDWLKIKTQEHQ
jgi:hypothetical protein